MRQNKNNNNVNIKYLYLRNFNYSMYDLIKKKLTDRSNQQCIFPLLPIAKLHFILRYCFVISNDRNEVISLTRKMIRKFQI